MKMAECFGCWLFIPGGGLPIKHLVVSSRMNFLQHPLDWKANHDTADVVRLEARYHGRQYPFLALLASF